MTVSQPNAADTAELNNLLVVNHDRGGFYLRYYELTGSTQALLQAHITNL
ncbi:hypothetical protein GGQ85_004196 [Nitrobacter vulgaris]|nr:hypothetical protein [Nitrobacter vulgaris]MDR6306464.1 hypothetical protein [Nitrobacter vulgaris]